MKLFQPLFLILFISPYYGKSQYIENVQTDTNLYQIIARWDTLLPPVDTVDDGPRAQFNRWRNLWEPRLYPTGSFKLAIDATNTYANNLSSNNSQLRLSSVVTANWTPDGPSSPTGFGIGQVDCLAFDPNDNNTIYAGSLGGGVWKTTDEGLNWYNLNTDHQLAQLGILAISLSQSNPNVIFTTAHTALHTFFVGIYRSVDAGLTWQLVNNGLPIGNSVGIASATKIYIDPINPNVVIVATSSGLFKTTNAMAACQWNLLNTPGDPFFYDILFEPNTQLLFASGKEVIMSADNGSTWTSTNLLSDANLSGLTVDRIAIDAVFFNSSLFLYAAINIAGGLRKFFLFDGSTWTFKGTSSMQSDNARIPLAVSPSDPNIVLSGEIGLYHSTTGAAGFNYISTCHGDQHDILFKPGDPTKIFIAEDGGVCMHEVPFASNYGYRSNGLEIATSYNVSSYSSIDPDRDFILSGHQDDGNNLFDSDQPIGQQWQYKSGGDGFEQMIDYSDFNNMYSTSYGYFSPNGNGCLFKSTNANNFSLAFTSNSETSIFGAPLAIDSRDHLTLYQGRINIWKTDDGWNSRYKISDFQNEQGAGGYQACVALAVAPSDHEYIYAAVIGWPNNHPPEYVHLYKTTQGGGIGGNCPNPVSNSCWEEVTPSQGFLSITGIAISDKNPDHVWVSYGGYDQNNKVKFTSNGGATWNDYNDGLPTSPSFPANHIVYEKGSNDGLYLATDIGVYYRNKTMTQWEPFMDNLPNVLCNWLDINYSKNIIRVATYGRSIWESPLACPPDNDLTLSGTITSDFFQEAENDIFSTENISNGSSTYRAGGAIELNPGFEANASSSTKFFAYIHACDHPGNSFRRATENPEIASQEQNNNFSSDHVFVYPNPNHGYFTLRMPEYHNSKKSILVTDLVGNKIGESNENFDTEISIDISKQAHGIYIVKIINGDNVVMKKIVFL